MQPAPALLFSPLSSNRGIMSLTHRQTETALRQLSQIEETVPTNFWQLAPSGNPIFFSGRMAQFLGLSVADMSKPGMSCLEAFIETIHPTDAPKFRVVLNGCLSTGETFGMIYRHRRADGTYRWMSGCAEPIKDECGRITRWNGLSHDVDDLIRTGPAVGPNEQHLQRLVDAVPAMIWSTTPDGTTTYLNKRYVDVVGATLADLTAPDGSPSPLAVAHPDDRAVAEQVRARAFESGGPYVVRYRQIRRGGAYRWTETRAEPLRDDAGAILQWHGVAIDIEDLVTVQSALRDRERELSLLVDMVPSHVWRLTPEGEPTFFNKRMVDFLGLNLADTNNPGIGSLAAMLDTALHPDDATAFRDALARCLASGEGFVMRYRLRRFDGVYRWMSSRAEPMRDDTGRILQWYGLCHDIDDQVRAEHELRASKRQLEQMIDAVPVNILSFSASGKLTYTSKRYLDVVGSPASHVENFDALAREVAHPADFPAMFRNASNGFETGQPFVNRFRRREKDGVYRWIEARARPLRDANGAIVQWYIASIDIEDEMRAQEALRERERTLRQLVETLPAMIDCAAPNGEPIYRSRQMREFLGYELEKLDSNGISRLQGTLDASVHPDDLAGVEEDYARSLSTGAPYARRHRLRRFDGEYRWVETRAAPMRNPKGAIVQWNVICLDIDAEVRAQIELRSAQEKMARASQAASLAELSASIAHEVNQPLAAIVATSHACRRWLSADPPNLERAGITLDRIIRDANSAADVVSRIRALFSQASKTRTRVDMGEVIREVCLLLADDLAARNTQVETEFSGSLPPTLADRVQMQQVLVNLIRNGIDAMEGVGDRPRLIRIRAFADGSQSLRFELQDQGAGLTEPERAFEPFFTTKRSGMGMGLAICRSIIESHDGRLWVPNSGPTGTTLAFTLPIEARA
ncbi:MAG: PAS domain-containing protein [Hyphomicrobiaceae bacterium]